MRRSDAIAFLLLVFLCYESHEWARHLAGAVLCGGFGTMTFTVAATRRPCLQPTIVTLSGPVLTYSLAFVGMFLLLRGRHALFAYALVFASLAHVRWIQTLTGRGDELVLAQRFTPTPSRTVVAIAVFLIGLPPVIVAGRMIANRPRWSALCWSWLLPLAVVFVLLFADKVLFEVTTLGRSLGSFMGVYVIVLGSNALVLARFIGHARTIRSAHDLPGGSSGHVPTPRRDSARGRAG
jgi:hypothetical protein